MPEKANPRVRRGRWWLYRRYQMYFPEVAVSAADQWPWEQWPYRSWNEHHDRGHTICPHGRVRISSGILWLGWRYCSGHGTTRRAHGAYEGASGYSQIRSGGIIQGAPISRLCMHLQECRSGEGSVGLIDRMLIFAECLLLLRYSAREGMGRTVMRKALGILSSRAFLLRRNTWDASCASLIR